MRNRKEKRRGVNRRLKRQAKREKDQSRLGLIRGILADRPMQNELTQRLHKEYRRDKKLGAFDGTFLEWLQSVNWERFIEILTAIFAIFAGL